MKKYLLFGFVLIGSLFFKAQGSEAKTLYDCFQQKGIAWTSISNRAIIAAEQAVWQYKGTAVQNTLLSSRLCPVDSEGNSLLGFSVATGYEKNLRVSMDSTQTTVPVTSFVLKDGTTLDVAALGGKIFLTVEPGTTREEIMLCTGSNSSTINFDPCVRGLSFSGTSTAGVAANRKAHNAGSKVIMSNVHYVYEQFVDVNDKAQTIQGNRTATGTWTFYNTPIVTSATYIATNPAELVTLYTINQVTSTGCINASQTVRGCVEEATGPESLNISSTTGATGARLYINPSTLFPALTTHLNRRTFLETIAAGQVIFSSSTGSGVGVANANNLSEVNNIIGVAYESGASSDIRRFFLPGSVININFLYPTPFPTGQGTVYVGDNGFPTSSPGTIRKIIGTVFSTNEFVFNPTVETPTSTPGTTFTPVMTSASGTIPINLVSTSTINGQIARSTSTGVFYDSISSAGGVSTTASRSLGVDYTNNSSKAKLITVSFSVNLSSGGSVSSTLVARTASAAGIASTTQGIVGGFANNVSTNPFSIFPAVTFIVPSGYIYGVFQTIGSAGTITNWAEAEL